MERDAIRRPQPNVFYRQTLRMPIAVKLAGFVREEDQVRFKDSCERQHRQIGEHQNARNPCELPEEADFVHSSRG